MSEDQGDKPKKGGGGAKMLLVGGALALVLGGGAFFVVYSGIVALPLPPANPPAEAASGDSAKTADSGHGAAHGAAAGGPAAPPAAAFAPVEPILVSLGDGAALRQLQLTAQLEVDPASVAAVQALEPRVRDVLTTYLRAVSPADVDDPAALLRIRAQMLRRVQVVTGEGLVRDLLVTEFVLR
jgi:flagellar FliL protein